MKAKKAKDFVDELIDDILSSDDSSPKDAGDKTTPIEVSVEKSIAPEPTSHHEPTAKLPHPTMSALDLGGKSTRSKSASSFEQGVRTAVGGKFALKPGASVLGMSSDAALIQSENLRVAQQKIFELEEEISRLRTDNEQLAAAGETIRKRADELHSENELINKKLTDLKERQESENEILNASLKAKDREVKELKLKNDEFEMRLSSNLQKIRVRERELENRLELIKMESTAVVRSKDEMILDLKRQIDQLSNELENYRTKGQELNRQLDEKQEALRRTVKALRLALNMLEGSNDEEAGIKKAK